MITMRAIAHSYDGPNIYNNRKTVVFAVEGLSGGRVAQIVKNYSQWRINQTVGHSWREGKQDFATPEEALASLKE